MTRFSTDPLDRLAPALPWEPNWPDVLHRADTGTRAPDRAAGKKRRLLLAFAVVGVVAVPLVAYGAASDWWFLGSGSPPPPAAAPVIVKEGEWSGHAWQLVAYPSTTDGLCVSMTPKGSMAGGEGAAMSCAPIAGVPRTPETKATPDMTITVLAGLGSNKLPAYIVGPVVGAAAEVAIRFSRGQMLRMPTFSGPASLGNVRFYAAELPADIRPVTPPQPGERPFVDKLIGLDSEGNVVACLVPSAAVEGVSPLSDCRG